MRVSSPLQNVLCLFVFHKLGLVLSGGLVFARFASPKKSIILLRANLILKKKRQEEEEEGKCPRVKAPESFTVK